MEISDITSHKENLTISRDSDVERFFGMHKIQF
jgi:hypothetical protein